MPDKHEVWRAAELLEDFKGAPCKLKILYEEAEVSYISETSSFLLLLKQVYYYRDQTWFFMR